MGIVVCYKTCWCCLFGECPFVPHPWWDRDDVEHAEAAGLPAPEGNCVCPYCRVEEGG